MENKYHMNYYCFTLNSWNSFSTGTGRSSAKIIPIFCYSVCVVLDQHLSSRINIFPYLKDKTATLISGNQYSWKNNKATLLFLWVGQFTCFPGDGFSLQNMYVNNMNFSFSDAGCLMLLSASGWFLGGFGVFSFPEHTAFSLTSWGENGDLWLCFIFSSLVRHLYLCKEVDLFEGADGSALEIRGACEKAVVRGIDGCGKGWLWFPGILLS